MCFVTDIAQRDVFHFCLSVFSGLLSCAVDGTLLYIAAYKNSNTAL